MAGAELIQEVQTSGADFLDEAAFERGEEFMSRIIGHTKALAEYTPGQPRQQEGYVSFRPEADHPMRFINREMVHKTSYGVDAQGHVEKVRSEETIWGGEPIEVYELRLRIIDHSSVTPAQLTSVARTDFEVGGPMAKRFVAVFDEYRITDLPTHKLAIL